MGALGLIQEGGINGVALWTLRLFGLIIVLALIGLVSSGIVAFRRSRLWKRLGR